MIKVLRKIISLNNLQKKPALSKLRKGQIATLLILMMVVVLIFIMVTVNIGQTSLSAANMANAADVGSLTMASQLATNARFIAEHLGKQGAPETRDCKNMGIAGIVFAIIGAIVAVVCAPAGYAILAGAVGGAVGGAIGGDYAGTGWEAGAVEGAFVGMSVGMGGAGVANAAAAGTSTVAPMVGAALQTTAPIYTSCVGSKMSQDAYAAMGRSLSELGQYDQIREGAFSQVFLQVVDEPNEIIDLTDADEDGKKDDKVLPFLVWWQDRIKKLKDITKELIPITQDFFHDMDDFVQEISTDKCIAWGPNYSCEYCDDICVAKSRCYLNLLFSDKKIYKKESIAEMVQGIQTALGSEFCVFYPKSINYIIAELKDFSKGGDQLLTELENYGISPAVSTWDSWFPTWYSPSDTGNEDFYKSLTNIIYGADAAESYYGLGYWLHQLNEAEAKIRLDYPECEKHCPVEWEEGEEYIDYSKCHYTNSPCYLAKGGCSVDEDLTDEITEAKNNIIKIMEGIQGFRLNIESYYNSWKDSYNKLNKVGGLNPAVYSWNDSRGGISISVEAGPYRMARITTKRKGSILNRKVCSYLTDSTDDGRCWIKVSRTEDANSKTLGILGRWNPVAEGKDKFTISRTSKAYYNYDRVGLSGTSK